jgi:hypothetical protein
MQKDEIIWTFSTGWTGCETACGSKDGGKSMV